MRSIELDVLPTARRHGMGILTYSPLAGRWLSGNWGADSSPTSQARPPARFDMSDPDNQRKLHAIRQLTAVAKEAGIAMIELAIAFVIRHPAVTSAIIGPRTMEQLDSQLSAADVELSTDVLDRIDEIVAPMIAAEITNSPADFSSLDPMVEAALAELEQAGVTTRPEVALADAQYWNEQHMDGVIANKHIQVLIPPDSAGRADPRPGWTGGRYSWMRTVLGAHGKLLYRRRIQMIEPVFAHTKHNRTITRFHRRGRKAVRTEWRLLMATHNLTKLHRQQPTAAGA